MQYKIQEIAESIDEKKQGKGKVSASELMSRELENCLIEDKEYTYGDLQSMISGMNSLQFIDKDTLITTNEIFQFNTYRVEKDSPDMHDLIMDRFSKGFQFDPKQCSFAHPDMFHFIQLCYEEVKNQQQTPMQLPKGNRIGGMRSQQDIQPLVSVQKPKENSYLDGIYVKEAGYPIQKEYLEYTYYTNSQITKLIDRCGWKSGDTLPFESDIYNQFLLTGQYNRAAAIAAVHFNFRKAIEILLRPEQTKTPETYWILMALQGIEEAIKDKPSQGQIAKKLMEMPRVFLQNLKFADPYFELIAEFIKKDKFIEYLNFGTNQISIFDRVGLWARFCQGKTPIISNVLDHIILYGRCEQSVDFLQQYLDDKNDLQLAGVIACHLAILDYPKKDILIRIFQSYIEYLIKQEFQIAELLCKIKQTEVENSKQFLSEAMKQYLQPQISMICSFCKNPLGQPYIEIQRKSNPRRGNLARDDNPRTNICPSCSHRISNCVVCAQYFTLPNNQEIDRKRGSNQQRILDTLKIDQAMVWCLTCKHGGHQQHIEEWFELYQKCPACDCECGII